MKTFELVMGGITVENLYMSRGSGYGQYYLNGDFTFENKKVRVKKHTTDSQAWDDNQDCETPGESYELLIKVLGHLLPDMQEQAAEKIADMIGDQVS